MRISSYGASENEASSDLAYVTLADLTGDTELSSIGVNFLTLVPASLRDCVDRVHNDCYWRTWSPPEIGTGAHRGRFGSSDLDLLPEIGFQLDLASWLKHKAVGRIRLHQDEIPGSAADTSLY